MHHRDGPKTTTEQPPPPILIKAEEADMLLPVDAGTEHGRAIWDCRADSPTSHGVVGVLSMVC